MNRGEALMTTMLVALVVNVAYLPDTPAQTPPEVQAVAIGEPVVLDKARFVTSETVLFTSGKTNIGWVGSTNFAITDLASARDGDNLIATVSGVCTATNTMQHSNASGCPMHGRFAFSGMVLTSNPPQFLPTTEHNHPPGGPCYPHVPPTERWTVTEVVKTGTLRVLGESFPFKVTVSKTTNSHEVLRQEWRSVAKP